MGGDEQESQTTQTDGGDLIRSIAAICNGCRSKDSCEIARNIPVIDRCEKVRNAVTPLIHGDLRHSVFVFPSTPLYRSISREIPLGKLHS